MKWLLLLAATLCACSHEPKVEWECARPRKWCHSTFDCISFGSYSCYGFDWREHCEDLCDEWRKKEQGK